MALAKEVICKVIHKIWLTPTVVGIRFEPNKRFKFDPGQFMSVVIPKPFAPPLSPKRLRRIYSIASAPENGYELSVKITGGPGPAYLASLSKGDVFVASAPYGDFVFDPQPGRNACFVSTGTGIAPFRSIIQSRHFKEHLPERAMSLFGARTTDEILYQGEFAKHGVEEIFAISRPESTWPGYQGRVTDYLNQLPADWPWHSTQFYLCGSGDMVSEVKKLLKNGRGVPDEAIHAEVYFANRRAPARTDAQDQERFRETLRTPGRGSRVNEPVATPAEATPLSAVKKRRDDVAA